MSKVVIIQPIAEEGVTMLAEQGYDVQKIEEDYSVEHLKQEVVDADAILIRTAELPREVIEAGKNLKVIARHGAGVDNIDVQAATDNGIYVTNAPVANNDSVAEHVVGYLVPLAKNMVKSVKAQRKGQFEVRDSLIGSELKGKTLGIVGLGKIGQKVARKAAQGFEMNIIAYDPYVKQEDVESYIEVTDDWDRVFKEGDFISLNLPLNDKTRGIVGRREFELMKETAYLINCARGPIVKEEELIAALDEGLIAGAGIDVYTEEPPAVDNPLFKMDNVIVTPHMAAHTKESMTKMATHAAQGIIEVLGGKTPTWPVNKI